MMHTTFVPYREFENVLGIKGIDEYIRYGSTMSLGGIDYNRTGMTFATKESAAEYVDSAIARNIQHSLKNYKDGTHFRHLAELFEADELTSAINRIVEDINYRFTLSVLTKDFKSNDLSLSAKNLLRDRQEPNTILQQIDTEEVTQRLRRLLEIKNKPEQTVEIRDVLSDIHGRMMEDIVLLETKMAFPKCEVFKLVFAHGEFDMVVFDPDAASCAIYLKALG